MRAKCWPAREELGMHQAGVNRPLSAAAGLRAKSMNTADITITFRGQHCKFETMKSSSGVQACLLSSLDIDRARVPLAKHAQLASTRASAHRRRATASSNIEQLVHATGRLCTTDLLAGAGGTRSRRPQNSMQLEAASQSNILRSNRGQSSELNTSPHC